MAHLIPNSFSSYEMTDEEELQAQVLTIGQKQLLQTKLSVVAEEKLALEVDPANINSFIQQEADLKGQMIILNWLIDCSNTAEQAIYDQAHQANN